MEMRSRQHLSISVCIFIFMMEMCRTETIDVTFSTTLNEFTYTLDVDPYDREYNCLVPNDNTEKEWSYAPSLTSYSNPINIYDLYKEERKIEVYQLVCIRKGVITNSYVGSMNVEVIEGGHISVEGSGLINREYTSNITLNVTQNTADFILTCSARTGEWILPNGDTSSSFPVITIPSVTSQHSGTYSCRRVLANMVVFIVELDLTVIPEISTGVVVKTLTTTSSIKTTTPVTTPLTTVSTVSTVSTVPMVSTVPTVSTVSTVSTASTVSTVPIVSTAPTVSNVSTVSMQTPSHMTESITISTKSKTTRRDLTSEFPTSGSKLNGMSTITNPPLISTNATAPRTGLSTPTLITIIVVIISICCIVSVISFILFICMTRYLKRNKQHLHIRLTTDPTNTMLASVPAAQTGLYYELDTYQGVTADAGRYYEIMDTSNSFTVLKCEIESLTADKDLKLKREFESIPHTSTHTMDTARLSRNHTKNRYQDILPYDHTRVSLSGACEYINASFVPIGQEPNVFIATQGPLVDTVADLWHMLLQYNVSCVVQLTDPVENGRRRCELYWPECQDRGMKVSGMEIQLEEEVCEGEWFRRELGVTQSGNTSTLTQFHYTGWRDGTVPEDTSGMVEMLRGVKERHNTDTPICVVCTSGVGRTGVFISLYTAMKPLDSDVQVCLPEIVRNMREYRPYMVQTVEQYKFVYLCLLEMCLRERGVEMSHSHPDSEATVARIEEEFTYLEFLDSMGSVALISDAIRPENQAKNTHNASLPYDRNRVVLEADSWHKGDYVNASYVRLRGVETQFIAALNPHSHTSAAFLQMLWQSEASTVVALETVRGWGDMVSGASSSCCYWPEEGLRTEIDRFSVETVSSERIGNLIKQTLRLTASSVSQSRPLTHYLLMEWEDTGTPSHLLPVVKLAEHITHRNADPVVVHCSDAVGKTGVFVVLCCAVAMMRRGESVNLMQLVKSARAQRRRMVCSKAQYADCYQLISEYRQTVTYQNIST